MSDDVYFSDGNEQLKQSRWFRSNFRGLYENPKYKDKFLIIYHERVEEVFSELEKALEYVETNFSPETYAVEKCVSRKEITFSTPPELMY